MVNVLIIVESAAKARAIKKCLDNEKDSVDKPDNSLGHFVETSIPIGTTAFETPLKGYEILATHGPIRNLSNKALPKSKTSAKSLKPSSIDTDNSFKITYQFVEKSRKHVEEIAKALDSFDELYIATNPDLESEGVNEAFAWHLLDILKTDYASDFLINNKPVKRILLHEISRNAIQNAMVNARDLCPDIYKAYKTRQVIDQLIMEKLSPLLSKKIRPGLHAERLDNLILHMIVEREQAIASFDAMEYWSVEASLSFKKQKFSAALTQYQSTTLDKFSIHNSDMTTAIEITLNAINHSVLIVSHIEKNQTTQQSPLPYITTSLLQHAAEKFNFTAKRTMRTATQLYEGIDTGEGEVSLISHMHTDSVYLSIESIESIRETVSELYGKELLKNQQTISDAWLKSESALESKPESKSEQAPAYQYKQEAIRPTHLKIIPKSIKSKLSADQFKIYQLIWNHSLSCEMKPATIETDTITFDAKQGTFQSRHSHIIEHGFLSIFKDDLKALLKDLSINADDSCSLPALKVGDKVKLLNIISNQHYTATPLKYNETDLINSIDEKAIAPSSSYATIITRLQNREYIELSKKRFSPTDVGRVIDRFLSEHFSQFVDYNSANFIERALVKISRGEQAYLPLLHQFWEPLNELIIEKTESVDRNDVTQEATDEKCPKCDQPLSIRLGRRGRFIGCTSYPLCDYTRNLEGEQHTIDEPEVFDEKKCPLCSASLALKQGRYGKFIGCTAYPECKHIEPLDKPEDSGVQCPTCKKGNILKRKSRFGKVFYSCSTYPKCHYSIWNPPLDESCPICQWPILSLKTNKRNGTEKVCPQKNCNYSARHE